MEKTLATLWKQYRERALPRNITPEQERLFEQTFMTGAFAVISQFDTSSTNPEAQAEDSEAFALMRDLHRQAFEWNRARSKRN